MTPRKILIVLAAALSTGACVSRTEVVEARPVVLSGSEAACRDFGFVPGTVSFDRCVAREHAMRVRGRAARDYAEAQLVADARDACYSYGLEPGRAIFDRCVGREIDARRYRDSAEVYVPAPPPPAVVYPAPSYPAAPYVETRSADTTGIPAFKDEYGFRYDAQGNRLDRYGNIISPQTRTP